MKRVLVAVALLFGLATGVAQAQTRVGVSLSFGDPYFDGQVVIGQPYYHRYPPYYYYRYRPAPPARVIVASPRVVGRTACSPSPPTWRGGTSF